MPAERRRYRSPDHGWVEWIDRPFVAWDGEGVSPVVGKPQNYVLFGNSRGEHIVSGNENEGLGSNQCLSLLLNAAIQDPTSIHVIFGGGYDFNMMMKDLPQASLQRLWTNGMCFFGDYKIEWIPGKHLTVWDRKDILKTTEESDGSVRYKYRSVTLWDVHPFFQTSFLNTLRTWEVGDEETLARIEAGKANRNTFDFADLADIVRYWRAELDCLVELMGRFRQQLHTVGIHLGRWDGPGAVASHLYRHHKTKQWKQDIRAESPEIGRLAQHAFAGGRVELVRYGNRENGDIRVYDINSAYPAEIAGLPRLDTARWALRNGSSCEIRPFSLYRIRFNYPVSDWGYVGTFPLWHRAPDGSVNFGNHLEGWYWTPEAAHVLQSVTWRDACEVVEWWEFVGDTESRPFAWVEEMYYQRRKWKEEGNGAERCLKLGLNSLYGKMAQQTGWREGRPIPPFHQLEWAGLVTSGARARIADALGRTSSVVGIETDGILVNGKIAELRLGSGLGEWDCKQYRGVTYVQPGVYWLRDEHGDWSRSKFRGFDKSLSRERVVEAYGRIADRCREGDTPDLGDTHLATSVTRFRGIGLSLSQNRMQDWRVWADEPRNLQIVPYGRKRQFRPQDTPQPHRRLAPTDCIAKGDGSLSQPHPLLWSEGRSTLERVLEDDWERTLPDSPTLDED